MGIPLSVAQIRPTLFGTVPQRYIHVVYIEGGTKIHNLECSETDARSLLSAVLDIDNIDTTEFAVLYSDVCKVEGSPYGKSAYFGR